MVKITFRRLDLEVLESRDMLNMILGQVGTVGLGSVHENVEAIDSNMPPVVAFDSRVESSCYAHNCQSLVNHFENISHAHLLSDASSSQSSTESTNRANEGLATCMPQLADVERMPRR